jgi:hypothetical protein
VPPSSSKLPGVADLSPLADRESALLVLNECVILAIAAARPTYVSEK